jgi:hypothetical protein
LSFRRFFLLNSIPTSLFEFRTLTSARASATPGGKGTGIAGEDPGGKKKENKRGEESREKASICDFKFFENFDFFHFFLAAAESSISLAPPLHSHLF